MNLRGNGFILRHAKLSDAKCFFECEQDKVARRNFMSTPKSVKEVRERIRKDILEHKEKKPKVEKFAIEVNGKCAGYILIDRLDVKYGRHKWEIGYCIHKDFRGKGIGSKAIKLITNYAFKKHKSKRIWCFTRTFNKGSRRALEKAGYKLEGVLRKNKCKNGKYLDDCIYAKIK